MLTNFVYIIFGLTNVVTARLCGFGYGPYISNTTGNVMRLNTSFEEVPRPSHLAKPNYQVPLAKRRSRENPVLAKLHSWGCTLPLLRT